MQLHQRRTACRNADRLEQAVTVGQAAIFQRQSVSRLTVDLIRNAPFEPIEVRQLAYALTEKWNLQMLSRYVVEDHVSVTF